MLRRTVGASLRAPIATVHPDTLEQPWLVVAEEKADLSMVLGEGLFPW
jgi:hypothetical protein